MATIGAGVTPSAAPVDAVAATQLLNRYIFQSEEHAKAFRIAPVHGMAGMRNGEIAVKANMPGLDLSTGVDQSQPQSLLSEFPPLTISYDSITASVDHFKLGQVIAPRKQVQALQAEARIDFINDLMGDLGEVAGDGTGQSGSEERIDDNVRGLESASGFI